METGKRILVVDNEKDMTSCLQTILQGEGYEVETANSGEEALAKVKERSFNLVLTDISMPPGMSGLELLSRVLCERPDTAVVVMSGFDPEHPSGALCARQAFERGAAAFVVKPFDYDHLLSVISRALSEPSHATALA